VPDSISLLEWRLGDKFGTAWGDTASRPAADVFVMVSAFNLGEKG